MIACEYASIFAALGCKVAILGGMSFETFIDAIFNFPTYAESYRIAALDLLGERFQRARLATSSAAE
ncbi:MAG TPA: hypothetical protein VHV51_09300 [Polyangiaceae bacterium]|nr:hypothetical protein [Polyangiaceae bacterium]